MWIAVMSKRTYPHKAEDERRIIVSFSISGPSLEQLRKRLEKYMHTPPTKNDIQAFARGKAYTAIEDYLASSLVIEEDEE
jgi:uncharacterized membrane protein YebE (DUF533 family)